MLCTRLTDCVKNLVETMIKPNAITSVFVWVDMAGHFTGQEMTATLLDTLPKQYKLFTEVNHFVEHHGKSFSRCSLFSFKSLD